MITIRASSLPMYPDCPRRASTSILKDELKSLGYAINSTPMGIGAIVGTAAHAGARYALESKKSGTSYRPSECYEISVECLKASKGHDTLLDDTTPNMNTAERQLLTLTNSFINETIGMIEPTGIELRRKATFAEDVIISGQLDVEGIDAIDDEKYGTKCGIYHAQLGCYSLLKQTETGIKSKRLTLHHMPRVPVTKPYPGAKHYQYDVDTCERACFATIQCILRDVRLFLKKQDPWAFQANPASMLCSPKYCSAHGTDYCELTQKKATIIV